ncbi:MAG: phosphosulfolactate synthase [Ignavibacteriales bacterium]|nr:phosphosulfolactate synthase [Ignavibacteriales bacterium]
MREETTKEIKEHLLKRRFHSAELMRTLGVLQVPPLTAVLDTGFDPLTVESHLTQSGHLMSMMKMASAGWLIADENALRQKVSAAQRYNVPVVMGNDIFVLSQAKGRVDDFLELCADIGVSRIEVDYFTVRSSMKPRDFAVTALRRDLQFIAEIALHDHGLSHRKTIDALVERAQHWLDAGAVQLLVTSIEKQPSFNTFSSRATLNYKYVDAFAKTFGLHSVVFDTPSQGMSRTLLDYFGPDVNLGGVRFGDLLNIEAYRRGLHTRALHNRSKRRLVTAEDAEKAKNIESKRTLERKEDQ